MRSFDTATSTHIGATTGFYARVLIWIVAKDRTTGTPTPLGLWNGDDALSFTIGGVARTYYGAGALLSVEPMVYGSGTLVRTTRANLSPIAPEVAQVIRGYEPRLAPVEIHRALFDVNTMALVAEPHRVFKGWIDGVRITTPEIGGEASCEVTMASAARALTRTLPLKKSDETQKLRGGDRFRRWADISALVDVYWGEGRAKAATTPVRNPLTSGGRNDKK